MTKITPKTIEPASSNIAGSTPPQATAIAELAETLHELKELFRVIAEVETNSAVPPYLALHRARILAGAGVRSATIAADFADDQHAEVRSLSKVGAV